MRETSDTAFHFAGTVRMATDSVAIADRPPCACAGWAVAAGRAMAGDATPYTHLPFFYSDLFEMGYEAVGELDPQGETVVDWKEPLREGVIYYLRDRRVRGVLLWNTWGQVEAARQLIAEPGPVSASALKGRLPACVRRGPERDSAVRPARGRIPHARRSDGSASDVFATDAIAILL